MQWENLSTTELMTARGETGGVCIVPIGCMEKHGTHMPVGTDIFTVRRTVIDAVKIEPAVVFPFMPFGQINEARHKIGTIAFSVKLLLDLFEELFAEISRNGFKKIILVNQHGGNASFMKLQDFSLLNKPRDYMLYSINIMPTKEDLQQTSNNFNVSKYGHGGEIETSLVMAEAPGLVKLEKAVGDDYSFKDTLKEFRIKGVSTPIWWYSCYPNHFGGNPEKASTEVGEFIYSILSRRLADLIKIIKDDTEAPRLLKEFYTKASNPEV